MRRLGFWGPSKEPILKSEPCPTGDSRTPEELLLLSQLSDLLVDANSLDRQAAIDEGALLVDSRGGPSSRSVLCYRSSQRAFMVPLPPDGRSGAASSGTAFVWRLRVPTRTPASVGLPFLSLLVNSLVRCRKAVARGSVPPAVERGHLR